MLKYTRLFESHFHGEHPDDSPLWLLVRYIRYWGYPSLPEVTRDDFDIPGHELLTIRAWEAAAQAELNHNLSNGSYFKGRSGRDYCEPGQLSRDKES